MRDGQSAFWQALYWKLVLNSTSNLVLCTQQNREIVYLTDWTCWWYWVLTVLTKCNLRRLNLLIEDWDRLMIRGLTIYFLKWRFKFNEFFFDFIQNQKWFQQFWIKTSNKQLNESFTMTHKLWAIILMIYKP